MRSGWLEAGGDSAPATKALRDWIESTNPADKQRARWNDFLTALAEWSPGVAPPRALAYVLEKALDAWPELQAVARTLEFDRKKQELDAPARAPRSPSWCEGWSAPSWTRRLEITRGIHAVPPRLRSPFTTMPCAARANSRLATCSWLLAPGAEGARMLSPATRRMRADCSSTSRLDAEIDHWLLDEFQDTSPGQWAILRNLIDEAVQDPTEARSFFYVGDVKQSVYAWRGGDPRGCFAARSSTITTATAPAVIAEEHPSNPIARVRR